MSYSEERDELAELFGATPVKRKSGYADDLVESVPQPGTPKPPQDTAPTAESSAPLQARRPVKLRPPADVQPHPLDPYPAAQQPVYQPKAEAPARAPEPHIEDEEFLSYDLDDLPDFSDLDFNPVEPQKPAVAKTQAKAPAPEPAPREPRQPRPAPESNLPENRVISETLPAPAPAQTPTPASAPAPARASAPAPVRAATHPAPEKSFREAAKNSEIAFVSDSSSRPALDTNFLLDTHGLVKIYDGRTVVNGVDINVRPGEIVGLLGPNGAGKTTSFYMIVGLVPPNGGHVLFNGNDVTSMPMYQRARLGMGYLPQEESIFRKLTVEENIMAVMETLNIPRKEQISRCNDLLERFSITHIRKNIALTCSGGEKRRLTIARSLVTTPSLLMLDEPFSGVDPIAVNEIQNIVEDLRKTGLAILITDHNARQTLELVDRAYLIYEGKVLREGSRDFLINDPVSRELYLGDRFTM
jgi:lipopolysaccharide export system ATP-binding protein